MDILGVEAGFCPLVLRTCHHTRRRRLNSPHFCRITRRLQRDLEVHTELEDKLGLGGDRNGEDSAEDACFRVGDDLSVHDGGEAADEKTHGFWLPTASSAGRKALLQV